MIVCWGDGFSEKAGLQCSFFREFFFLGLVRWREIATAEVNWTA